jgi:hypothetical protein
VVDVLILTHKARQDRTPGMSTDPSIRIPVSILSIEAGRGSLSGLCQDLVAMGWIVSLAHCGD